MSTRFATVKIGAIWLTSTGLADGPPCKVRVENEAAFASVYAANTVLAADSTVHSQTIDRGVRGIAFGVVIEWCPLALFSSILAALSAALDADTSVRVIVTSLTELDVQARPVFEAGSLFTFESRSGGVVKNVRWGFIATGPGV